MVGAALLGASPAEAVAQGRMPDVGIHAGLQSFDPGTALEHAAFVGLDAAYALPWQPLSRLARGSTLGVALVIDGSRPVTRGTQFPLVARDVGDTTFLVAMAQRITLVQVGVAGVLGVPIGRSWAYGFAGAGTYTMRLDPRAQRRIASVTHPMATFGGGLRHALARSLVVRVEARAVRFTDFHRDQLDATPPALADRLIRDALPPPHTTSRTPTNAQYSIGIEYRPGRE